MSTVDIAEGRRLLAAATPGPWRAFEWEYGDRKQRAVEYGPGFVFNLMPYPARATESVALIVWLRNNAEALLAGTPDLPSRDELGAVIRDTLGQWAGQTIPPWPSDWSWLIADEVLRRLQEAPDGR